MEVILNDFQSTITNTGNAEQEGADTFAAFETQTQGDIDEKNGVIDTKEGEIVDAKGDITTAKDVWGNEVRGPYPRANQASKWGLCFE